MIKLTMGERIEDLIKGSNKSERKIVDELKEKYNIKISTATLSNIVSDVSKEYSYKYFIGIAKYFNVSTDYLLGLTDTPTPLKTEEQRALRVAADFTELNESLIYLIHTLSKNGNSVVNDLIGIIVEEYCFHIKLIEELKNSTERDLPNKIANIANRCENEETAKEVIWDAENEFNQNLAYKYLIENSLITAINKYFRFDEIQEKYKEFLANKEKILERFKVSENEQKES